MPKNSTFGSCPFLRTANYYQSLNWANLLYILLIVRDFQQDVLGILFSVYLLVVNFNCMSRWKAAVPLDAVECARTRSERIGRVNSNLFPIAREVGI